jgi:hypothetical protein
MGKHEDMKLLCLASLSPRNKYLANSAARKYHDYMKPFAIKNKPCMGAGNYK